MQWSTIARTAAGVAGAWTLAGAVHGQAVAVTNAGFEDLYLNNNNLPAMFGGDVPAGAFPVGDPPPGWLAYYPGGAAVPGASIGVLNPGVQADFPPGDPAYFPAGAPEGDNVVLLYFNDATGGAEFGVRQELAATLQADTRYTLTVEVGNIASGTALVQPFQGFGFFDLRGFPGYRIELVAGGVVIAEDDNSLVTAGTLGDAASEGTFQTATVQLDVRAGHPQLGEPLEIRLISRNEADVPGVTGIEVDYDDVQLVAQPLGAPVPLPPAAAALLAGLLAWAGASHLRRR